MQLPLVFSVRVGHKLGNRKLLLGISLRVKPSRCPAVTNPVDLTEITPHPHLYHGRLSWQLQ